MTVPAIISLLYGSLVLLGGWIGFKKAKSRPSLIAGALSGALLWGASFLCFAGNPRGPHLALVVSLLLLVLFGYRFAKGRKFMPSGLMATASLISAVALWITSSPR